MHTCNKLGSCLMCFVFVSISQVWKTEEESNEGKPIRNLESTVLDSGSNHWVEAYTGIGIEKESEG